jgi:hypothetical protein
MRRGPGLPQIVTIPGRQRITMVREDGREVEVLRCAQYTR